MANPRLCSIPDCGKPHKSGGYCNSHKIRFARYGDPLGGGPTRFSMKGRVCQVDGCCFKAQSRFVCKAHAVMLRKHGDANHRDRCKPGETLQYIEDVALKHESDACLVWPYKFDKDGYGTTNIGGKKTRANRVVCELVHGEAPDGCDAAHSCGNSRCVSPIHIVWKTRKNNILDKITHGTMARGERQGTSKLTTDQVRKIKLMFRSMTDTEIAKHFPVATSTIAKIRKGRIWSWLE